MLGEARCGWRDSVRGACWGRQGAFEGWGVGVWSRSECKTSDCKGGSNYVREQCGTSLAWGPVQSMGRGDMLHLT